MHEYILGNIFGITQVIIGHPFDTIKTNMQHSGNTNIFTTTRIFLQHPRMLYRGITYPLIMSSIGTSFLFGNYNYFNKLTNNNLFAGVLTGFFSTIALLPFDYKKIHLQTQLQSQTSFNTKSHNTYTKITKYYVGFTYTLVRECVSIPLYFYTYEYLTTTHLINPFISGGIAGINSWLFTYPFDTLKTRKQIYQSYSFQELFKMGNLFNGLNITLLRAFIVNSTCFYIYELLKKTLE